MSILSLISLTLATFLGAAVATEVLRRMLEARQIFDHPGARTSHEVVTPRGGGLAIYAVLMAAWGVAAVIAPGQPAVMGWIMACSLGLAIVSWADDLVGLPKMPRFLCQIAMASVGTYVLGNPVAVFQGTEDKVVPPDQAESIVQILQRNGVPHIYRLYEGEGHGWRKTETIVSFYDDVDRFLKQHVLIG